MRPDDVGRELREAGRAVAPAFSEELHERVMAGVRRERAYEMASSAAGRAWWTWAVGVASVAAVVIVAVIWMPGGGVSDPPAPVARAAVELPDVALLAEVVRAKAEPVGEKLYDARFAYLDRDGKRLARFLWRSVPGVPVEGEHEGTGKGS